MNFVHLAAADTAPDEWGVIVAIVLARLFVPLLIPRVPLLIIVALVLDAVDGSLLDAFTNVDVGPDGPYQSFDKALDIYYLSIAYLTMLRNWTSVPAFRIGQFLSSTTGSSACSRSSSRALARCCWCSRTPSSSTSSSTRRSGCAGIRPGARRASGFARRRACGSS